jgi:hypothetical protein
MVALATAFRACGRASEAYAPLTIPAQLALLLAWASPYASYSSPSRAPPGAPTWPTRNVAVGGQQSTDSKPSITEAGAASGAWIGEAAADGT